MKKNIIILITTMIGLFLHNQHGFPVNLISQCTPNNPLIQRDINNFQTIINSDYAEGNYPRNAIFIGNVDINQGNIFLQADKIQLNQKKKENSSEYTYTVDAYGNVQYKDNQIILKGKKGWINLNTKDISIWDGNYQMVNHQGQGKADLIKKLNKKHYIILNNGSFTSCFSTSKTWNLIGSKVLFDRKRQIVKVWNAYFKFGPLTLLYIPYLQLPIGDEYHSGFLIPNAKYSTPLLFEFSLPYYWNISSNMNATITPRYIYKKNSVIWENELRYLTHTGINLIAFDYIPSNAFRNKNQIETNQHRWLFHWKHNEIFNGVWYFNIDYTKVNDLDFFNNFDSKYLISTNDYNTQIFNLGYSTKNFNVALSTKKFQTFSYDLTSNYASIPQLDINWYWNNFGLFNFHVYNQLINFINTNSNMSESIRLHIEPTLYLPLYNEWINLDIETKFMATCYQQNYLNLDSKNYNTKKLKNKINRFLPELKINSQMVFERNLRWKEKYIQTLEPRIQYLYIPYYNQKKIKNHDSSAIYINYDNLFFDRTYSGLDRIASANKIIVGITSRFYHDTVVERFNISVGQTYCFSESQTGDENDSQWKNHDKKNFFLLAGKTYWRINNNLILHGSMQYNNRFDKIANSSATVEYFYNKNSLIQLNYHYINSDYVQTVFAQSKEHNIYIQKEYRKDIFQIGSIGSWQISDHWFFVGAYYYDTKFKKSIDQMIGFQYNSCCYAVKFRYERKLSSWNKKDNNSQYDNIIGFNIELHNFNSNSNASTQQMLRSNILPYHSSLQ